MLLLQATRHVVNAASDTARAASVCLRLVSMGIGESGHQDMSAKPRHGSYNVEVVVYG